MRERLGLYLARDGDYCEEYEQSLVLCILKYSVLVWQAVSGSSADDWHQFSTELLKNSVPIITHERFEGIEPAEISIEKKEDPTQMSDVNLISTPRYCNAKNIFP